MRLILVPALRSRGRLLACCAFLCLPSAALRAEQPPAPGRPADDAIAVTIKSGSGKERHPLHHGGYIDRIGLGPRQIVQVKLKCKGPLNKEEVSVSALDGGTIDGQDAFSESGEGNIEFSYQAGMGPGRYRVVANIAGQEYEFEFYVVDLNNPENNPPHVRVVD